ncbi:MAG: hypothetical protein ACI91O_000044 [Candidatus Poriferisodalaceae bacterium]|jgi:hypothetical protein
MGQVGGGVALGLVAEFTTVPTALIIAAILLSIAALPYALIRLQNEPSAGNNT